MEHVPCTFQNITDRQRTIVRVLIETEDGCNWKDGEYSWSVVSILCGTIRASDMTAAASPLTTEEIDAATAIWSPKHASKAEK